MLGANNGKAVTRPPDQAVIERERSRMTPDRSTDEVEAVARAIVQSVSGPFDFLDEHGKATARAEARAAIAALDAHRENQNVSK